METQGQSSVFNSVKQRQGSESNTLSVGDIAGNQDDVVQVTDHSETHIKIKPNNSIEGKLMSNEKSVKNAKRQAMKGLKMYTGKN